MWSPTELEGEIMKFDNIVLFITIVLIGLVQVACWITDNPWLWLLDILILIGQDLSYKIKDRIKKK